MSIAVSALVHPSKLLARLEIAMGLFVALIGFLVISSWGDGLAPIPRFVAAVICVPVSIWIILHHVIPGKSLHIDISGNGQIRIREYYELTSSVGPLEMHKDHGKIVYLMMSSTLWPHMMVLRLQGEDGQLKVVTILQDSMGAEEFRALSVACRWIATHKTPHEHKKL
jgi:toxin CptA